MLKIWVAMTLGLVLSVAGSAEVKVEPGVSLELAQYRKSALSDINYALTFAIPENKDEAIAASESATFTLSQVSEDLQFDFREKGENIKSVTVNGSSIPVRHEAEHLIIPARALKVGTNQVDIEFIAGDTSLNRNDDYLYTLFVPDRARTAFPVFDQPNLKATYGLTLTVPEDWETLSNGPLAETLTRDGVKTVRFATSDPMPSYLFSFVAGKFERVTRTIKGRTMSMLHRETDTEKVARNLDAIFDLHAASLDWLEDYTGVTYPFQKFDFALIPAFQYGGMEHVGAIQYRASSLFLDEDPSDTQKLGRANLIAHESAHMWFGNLVTMDWFNDVWTKEVYANFMAAKIVNPSFPDIDHDLNFLARSYPAAYGVDRTSGANPIRQHLPNLNEAGTLYGAIIYNKAPIMMRQLELLLGAEAFQDGIRAYMQTFAGGNATWPDLIAIFDERTDVDVKAWSEVWVNTPGRPEFVTASNALQMRDPLGKGRVWPQVFGVADPGAGLRAPVTFSKGSVPFDTRDAGLLLNADGLGYGLFPPPVDVFKADWAALTDLQKGSTLIMLYEQLLEAHEDVRPAAHLRDLMRVIEREDNQIILNMALGHMRRIYWSFLSDEARKGAAPLLEALLWTKMAEAQNPALTKTFYRAYADIALSPNALRRLEALWQGDLRVAKLRLSETDLIGLAGTLAVKIPEKAAEIVSYQEQNIKNPDRAKRFAFIKPALSSDSKVRDAFFDSLKDSQNREVESWVLAAIGYLHHPLRVNTSEKYILPSLELLEEIQQTGDIFFPARWTAVTMSNHRSAAAVKTVRDFLGQRPDYNHQLSLKILQSADMMFRAQAILAANGGIGT